MFIRIIKPDRPEKVIECTSYEVEHHKGDPDYMVLGVEPNRGTFSIAKTPGTAVYIMNNDGRTIDRFRWN